MQKSRKLPLLCFLLTIFFGFVENISYFCIIACFLQTQNTYWAYKPCKGKQSGLIYEKTFSNVCREDYEQSEGL